MKRKLIISLGVYNLLLAFFIIYTGLNMIFEKGVFNDYPNEWIDKIPIENWLTFGILLVAIFGVGNLLASFLVLYKKNKQSVQVSGLMALIILVGLIIFAFIINAVFLAHIYFSLLAIMQLLLCSLITYRYYRKKSE